MQQVREEIVADYVIAGIGFPANFPANFVAKLARCFAPSLRQRSPSKSVLDSAADWFAHPGASCLPDSFLALVQDDSATATTKIPIGRWSVLAGSAIFVVGAESPGSTAD